MKEITKIILTTAEIFAIAILMALIATLAA